MKISVRQYSLTSIFWLLSMLLFGQNQMVMYFMDDVPQSTATNVAHIPAVTVHLNPFLPSLGFSVLHSGFAMSDAMVRNEYDSLRIDTERIVKSLRNRNYLAGSGGLELFSLGIRFKTNNYIHFSTSATLSSTICYPGKFAGLLLRGNGPYVGQRLNFSDLAVNTIAYNQFALGYSRIISPKWQAGLRIKYLVGLANARFTARTLYFETENELYDLTVGADYLINTSYFDINNPGLSRNPGYGIDAGVIYTPAQNLRISLQVSDLGSIQWNDNVRSYSTNGENKLTFTGIDISQFYDDDYDISTELDKWIDSLNQFFIPEENNLSYTTSLPARVMLSGTWDYLNRNRLGILLEGELFNNRLLPSVSIMYQRKVGRALTVQGCWTAYRNTYANLGLGLSFQLLGFQYYLASSNILAPILPYHSKSFSVQTGFNILIGRKKYLPPYLRKTKEIPSASDEETNPPD